MKLSKTDIDLLFKKENCPPDYFCADNGEKEGT